MINRWTSNTFHFWIIQTSTPNYSDKEYDVNLLFQFSGKTMKM